MSRIALLAIAALAACAPAAPGLVLRDVPITIELPAMRSFTAAAAPVPTRSNTQMARDFIDLTFELENGTPLPALTRFETPISVRIEGPVPPTLALDLRQLIGRLQNEAGLDIFLTGGDRANITVQAIPSTALRRAVPGAACFVVPRVTDWTDFRTAAGTNRVDWVNLTSRDQVSIFLPSDAAPQEIRTCLHEELAQALGPVNDLFRLSDSVFNDDDSHSVLTGFDMLMLRVTYAPELRNGMTANQVAAQLPGIFARLNPAGQFPDNTNSGGPSAEWRSAMQTALAARTSRTRRLSAARTTVDIARTNDWTGARLGFSYFALAKTLVATDSDAALTALTAAAREFRRAPETQIHEALVAVQLAAYALRSGDADAIMRLTDTAIPIATRHENAALLATLMMFRAEALDLAGRTSEAAVVRMDSFAWARYGLGGPQAVQTRFNQITALNPRNRSLQP